MSAITTTLGTGCFMGNPKLKTVKISANITELGTDCFRSNDALTDIIFDAPENLQYIRQHCFGSDVSLKSPFSCKNIIQIGNTDIGLYAFDNCINIPYIDFRGRTTDYLPSIGTDEFYAMPNLKIIVDEDKYDDWMDTFSDCDWSPKICIDENGTKPQLINRNDYLTITALEDNVSIGFTPNWSSGPIPKYNLTGKDTGWLDFPKGGIILNSSGDRISFKGEFPRGSKVGLFDLPNKCDISGNADSLFPTILSAMDNAYKELFKDCVGIINAEELSFGSNTGGVDDDMFKEMFKGCTNLLSAPKFIFGTALSGSFFGLFDGCTNLNKIILDSTYSYNLDGQYIISVDENTLPDLSSKDEPGYLYVYSGGFNSYHQQDGNVNILKYAQSHNWVPLTKYADILYWNKDNIDERVTIQDPNGNVYNIGGYIGTGVNTEFKITSDPAFPYVCNIFTSPINTSYDWELVRRNARIYSGETIQNVLNREGINDNQLLQVIIMGTTTDEEI